MADTHSKVTYKNRNLMDITTYQDIVNVLNQLCKDVEESTLSATEEEKQAVITIIKLAAEDVTNKLNQEHIEEVYYLQQPIGDVQEVTFYHEVDMPIVNKPRSGRMSRGI
jgi:hypothetical protein